MKTGEIATTLNEPPLPPAGRSFTDVLGDLIGRVQRAEPIIEVLPCGLELIDGTVGGLIRGEFVGTVAPPGMGKTTMADQLVTGSLSRNPDTKAIIFSLETSSVVRAGRLVAAAAVRFGERGECVHCLPVGPMLRGELREAGQVNAIEAAEQLRAELGERLRFVDDLTTAADIANEIERERPDVVLIDHLGLVVSDAGSDSEVSRFDSALGRIVAAIRTSNTAAIIINETSKAALNANSVDMGASRGSARFASLAAMFIGLQKYIPPNPASPEARYVRAILAKSRYSVTGKQQVAQFFGGLSYFAWQQVEDVPVDAKKSKKDTKDDA